LHPPFGVCHVASSDLQVLAALHLPVSPSREAGAFELTRELGFPDVSVLRRINAGDEGENSRDRQVTPLHPPPPPPRFYILYSHLFHLLTERIRWRHILLFSRRSESFSYLSSLSVQYFLLEFPIFSSFWRFPLISAQITLKVFTFSNLLSN